jgi:O-antigen/teichoic acid export membrane protein
MQAAKRVVKNTIFLYVKMGITIFSSLYATRLILNALGINDFGIFNLIGGLITMLIFLNAAMTQASQRFMSYAHGKKDSAEQRNIFNISIVLHLIIGFFAVLLLESLGLFLFDDILKIDLDRVDAAKIIYQFMIVSTFFIIISVPYDAVINANEDMLFIAILGIFESLLKLGIAIYITLYLGDKLIVFGFLMAFLSMVVVGIKIFYSHKKYKDVKINFRKYFDKSLFKNMSSFTGYTLIGQSTSTISNYGQGFMLNIFFGTIVNAAQGIVGQVSGQLGSFAATMLRALNPMITKSEGAGNRELMLNTSFVGSRISFFLLIFFYVPIILEMPVIFNYWLVEIPEYTIVFCKLLLMRNLIEQLYTTLYSTIASVGNIKHFQIYNAILNIFPLPVIYILFSLGFSPVALYVVFIFYSIFQGGLYLFFAKRECGISIKKYFKEVILKSLVTLLVIILIVLVPYFLVEVEPYRLLSVVIVNIFAFSLAVWTIGLSKIEKDFILQLIKRKKETLNS